MAGRKVAGQVAERRQDRAVSRSGPAAGRRGDPPVHVVTVNRPAAEVMPGGRLPEPLAALGDAVQVTATPAPGGRGTELRARLVEAGAEAAGLHAAVRKALREAKMLLETGEVLLPDAPSTTEPTVLNAPLREAVAHGRDGGRL